MTLTIDTENKVVTLHEEVNVQKLKDTLETLGIDETWTIAPKIEIQTVNIPCLRKHYDSNYPWNTPTTEPFTSPYQQPWRITYHDVTPPYPYYRDSITCSINP